MVASKDLDQTMFTPDPSKPAREGRDLDQRNILYRLKSAAKARVFKSSELLWQAVFKECDSDNDGSITRRELLVLMKRLSLEIPSEPELTEIVTR